jgi:hypothetical protein
MLKEKRNRKRMGFWLDYGKDDELIVAEAIDELKKQRKYQRAIFQGIQLIASLWEGRVDVLLTMFPWVADVICQGAPPKDDMDELKARLARMENMLQQQQKQQQRPLSDPTLPQSPPGYPAMKPAGYVPNIAAPVAVVAEAKVATADEICDNFMAFLQ